MTLARVTVFGGCCFLQLPSDFILSYKKIHYQMILMVLVQCQKSPALNLNSPIFLPNHLPLNHPARHHTQCLHHRPLILYRPVTFVNIRALFHSEKKLFIRNAKFYLNLPSEMNKFILCTCI